jgi:hypothetical protein
MKSQQHRLITTAVVALSAFATWSCGRTSPAGPSPLAAEASASGTRVVGTTTTATPQVGTLKICKTGNVSGTFSIAATPVNGGTYNAPTPLTVAAGTCVVAAEDFDTAVGVGVNLVTTETSAGLQSVSGERIDAGVVTSFTATNGGELFVNNFHGYTLTFDNYVAPPPPPPVTVQGCSPGYFKNHTSTPAGFDRSLTLDSVLTTNVFPGTLTVGDALSLKGGGVNALARHAAAAVLNASALPGTYSYTLAQLRAIFDQIEAGTLTIEAASDLLASKEDVNGILCPLN